LNVTSESEISFEKTINTFQTRLSIAPTKTISLILLLILISLIVTYIFDKLFNYIRFRERRRNEILNKSIENYNKRQERKDQVFDKIIDSRISYLQSREKPWIRLKPEFHTIIVRDIRDKTFPALGDWSKLETFDLTKEGIEFLDGSNSIGFDLYLSKNYKWDVFHDRVKPKKKKYLKPEIAYCVDFLPYEDILHVDWEPDDYYGCPTIFCQFKFKKNGVRHPFKEFRYYILGNGFLTLLEERDKVNFKPFLSSLKSKVNYPFYRIKRYLNDRKYNRQSSRRP
jgi:hypothetical protein